ncbi:hypothetical protein [Gardnerella vaginalis]|uniref:hypothetical protein n=1 Tax=Gardnerella vaginalis TaxID=2702 RepID=UPI00036F7AB4|nr:hypothetical protein [Gardnerella vaginalis]
MMNKKAIAAFAAGATLLAGFAMATPAMAEKVNSCTGHTKEWCTVQVQDTTTAYAAAQKATADAQAAYNNGLSKYGELQGKVADLTAKAAAAQKAVDVANSAFDDDLEPSSPQYKVAQKALTAAQAAKDAADDALAAAQGELAKNSNVTALLNALTAAKNAEATAKAAMEKAQRDYAEAYPHVLTLEEKQKKAIAEVYATAQKVDETNHVFAHARENFVNAYGKMKAAKAELVEAKAQLDAAQLALDDFEASGVKDETKHEHLVVLRDRALANFNRVQNTVIAILTSPEYVNAKAAVDRATADHDRAVKAYEAAYNHAVELNVNPDLLPKITIVDPASAAFPELSEAKKIYDDALSGKFGAAAQKAVQKAEAKAKAEAGKNAPAAAGAQGAAGAAAGKAGAAAGAAKGELAGMGAKGGNGKGKAGEQLGNAGVGVALTALAASMLAGMGAAVRKMRH